MTDKTDMAWYAADADDVGGEVPEDPAGGTAGGPAVSGPRHQVPVGAALQGVRV